MIKKELTFIFSFCVVAGLIPRPAFAVSASANANMRVERRILVTDIFPFSFSLAKPGASREIIQPTDIGSLRLKILGEPGAAFAISLPTDVTLINVLANNQTISVSDFNAISSTACLNDKGSYVLQIGATRQPLSPKQSGGAYKGVYNIAVVY